MLRAETTEQRRAGRDDRAETTEHTPPYFLYTLPEQTVRKADLKETGSRPNQTCAKCDGQVGCVLRQETSLW
jgi:hypothetical protein